MLSGSLPDDALMVRAACVGTSARGVTADAMPIGNAEGQIAARDRFVVRVGPIRAVGRRIGDGVVLGRYARAQVGKPLVPGGERRRMIEGGRMGDVNAVQAGSAWPCVSRQTRRGPNAKYGLEVILVCRAVEDGVTETGDIRIAQKVFKLANNLAEYGVEEGVQDQIAAVQPKLPEEPLQPLTGSADKGAMRDQLV